MQTITKRANGSRRVSLSLPTESHVEQTHVGSTNINAIMRKYRKTGELPPPREGGKLYGDFGAAEDYHTTQNRLIEANAQFMDMPSHLRTRFDNDAGLFFQFVNDPDNLEEAQEMGLIASDEKPLAKIGDPIKPKEEEPPPPADPPPKEPVESA